MNRFQFVADHQRRHGVKRLCQVVGIARSSYHHWKAAAPDRAVRAAADARLAARIRMIHRDSTGTYGVPRITAELRDAGHVVNHKRVARVMRGIGLAGLRLRRRHRNTTADPAADACRVAGVIRSMGAVGSSADNAAAESLNASFKRETLQGARSWGGEREARLAAFGWLYRYNTRRRHSHLGQMSPIDYENSLTSTPATLTHAA